MKGPFPVSAGFLSAGAPQLSGNVAMFDMTAAVRWVQNYISFFGGDPNNIKTIGQGSGASSAVALGLSPTSQSKIYLNMRPRRTTL